MRKKFSVLVGFCVLLYLTPANGFGQALASGWYDEYGSVSWGEEQLRLDDFGMFLRRNSDYVGYIAIYRGPQESKKKVESRMKRIRSHLIRALELKEARLVFILKNKSHQSRTILQPTSRNVRPPDFP